jgi:nitrite reductase (NO-forming) / hydroxylamine reductase
MENPMNLRPPSLRHAALALATSLALTACGSDPQPGSDGTPASGDGRAAYLANCSACHQPDGRGLPGAFPPLAAADWLREQPTEASIRALLQGLTGPITVNGVTYNSVMPPVAHLSDHDISAILSYVYANWGNDGREVTAEMVATVRAGGSLSDAPAGSGGQAPAEPVTETTDPAAEAPATDAPAESADDPAATDD